MTEFEKNVSSWNEWCVFVLKELERLNSEMKSAVERSDKSASKIYEKLDSVSDKLSTKIEQVNLRITTIQVKVAGIAAASGIITSLLFLLLTHLLKGKTP
jgi:hypothetical protein